MEEDNFRDFETGSFYEDNGIFKGQKRQAHECLSNLSLPRDQPDTRHPRTDEMLLQLESGDVLGLTLPDDVLLLIFQYIAESDCPFPSLCRMACVNRRWRELAGDWSLYQKMDLSVSCFIKEEKTLELIRDAKDLSRLREINLAQWSNLNNSALKIIADSCPELITINVSGTNIDDVGLSYLFFQCSQLCSIDISSLKQDSLHGKSLKQLLETRGAEIHSLKLAHNTFKYFNTIMKLVSTRCFHLKLLDVSFIKYAMTVMYDIELLQVCCQQLEVLRIGEPLPSINSATPQEQVASLGFPNLQELVIRVHASQHGRGIVEPSNNYLQRILKTSYGLKRLDVGNCSSVSSPILKSLPLFSLQRLFMPGCYGISFEGVETVMIKWWQTLVELDLSHTSYPGMSLEMTIKKLPAKPKLEILHLSGTEMSCARVQAILNGCPKLTAIHLDACRGLPRRMRKMYSGDSLLELRRSISSIVAQAEKDVAGTTCH